MTTQLVEIRRSREIPYTFASLDRPGRPISFGGSSSASSFSCRRFSRPPASPPAQRILLGLAGIAILTALALLAIRNGGRRVSLDHGLVTVASPFASTGFRLDEVASIQRSDYRASLRGLERGDSPKFHTTGLDTIAAIIIYELRDSTGKALLRLDKGAEPAEELLRFIGIVEASIADRNIKK